MTLARALGHHSAFALEISRTVAMSEAERAQGYLQAVLTLALADTHSL